MEIELTGLSIIGQERGTATADSFRAFDPSTGETVDPPFYTASMAELERAARLADQARIPFGNTSQSERAVFLRRIADNIEALAQTLYYSTKKKISHHSTNIACAIQRMNLERAAKTICRVVELRTPPPELHGVRVEIGEQPLDIARVGCCR